MTQIRPTGFNILPDAVKHIMIINGLLYFASVVLLQTLGYDLTRMLGLHHINSEYFQPYQLVTHIFMHGSFMHILFNMFALWMFGSILENVWGSKRFVIFYFVTGLGAALIHSLVFAYEVQSLQQTIVAFGQAPSIEGFRQFIEDNVSDNLNPEYTQAIANTYSGWSQNPGDPTFQMQAFDFMNEFLRFKINTPTVGASGAVFGLLLAFGMLFPNTYIYLYFFFPIKAKYFVMLYGAFELWSGFRNNPADNVAHFAHLGGMLFGFILIKYWNKTKRREFY